MNRSDVSLTFQVPSDPRFLVLIRGAMEGLGCAYGLPGRERREIILAIDEAMANIIRHSYRGAPDQPIELRCEGSAGSLEFTLLDRGEAPDPSRLASGPPDDLTPGGRGTHIIRAVMDEVNYETRAGENRLRLRKFLPPSETAADGRSNHV